MPAHDPTSPAIIYDIKFCNTCGIELSLENARETRKRSASLRSKCRECERKEDRARHKAKYVKKHKKLISKGTWFYEQPNRVGMASQCAKLFPVEDKRINQEIGNIKATLINNKYIMILDDDICDECGGIRRYDEHFEIICEDCGLVGEEPVMFNQPDSEFASRQLKSYEKSRYKLRIVKK